MLRNDEVIVPGAPVYAWFPYCDIRREEDTSTRRNKRGKNRNTEAEEEETAIGLAVRFDY